MTTTAPHQTGSQKGLAPTGQPPKPPANKRTLIVGGVIAALVLVIVILLIALFATRGDATAGQQPGKAASTPSKPYANQPSVKATQDLITQLNSGVWPKWLTNDSSPSFVPLGPEPKELENAGDSAALSQLRSDPTVSNYVINAMTLRRTMKPSTLTVDAAKDHNFQYNPGTTPGYDYYFWFTIDTTSGKTVEVHTTGSYWPKTHQMQLGGLTVGRM